MRCRIGAQIRIFGITSNSSAYIPVPKQSEWPSLVTIHCIISPAHTPTLRSLRRCEPDFRMFQQDRFNNIQLNLNNHLWISPTHETRMSEFDAILIEIYWIYISIEIFRQEKVWNGGWAQFGLWCQSCLHSLPKLAPQSQTAQTSPLHQSHHNHQH